MVETFGGNPYMSFGLSRSLTWKGLVANMDWTVHAAIYYPDIRISSPFRSGTQWTTNFAF